MSVQLCMKARVFFWGWCEVTVSSGSGTVQFQCGSADISGGDARGGRAAARRLKTGPAHKQLTHMNTVDYLRVIVTLLTLTNELIIAQG